MDKKLYNLAESVMSSKLKFYLGLLIVLAGFVVVRVAMTLQDRLSSASAEVESRITPPPSEKTTENALTRDSDKDGLPDREEIIYGTDPFKSDSDDDSYLDGEEITTGHDPLDASSNDKTEPGVQDTKGPNLTDRMANLTVASILGGDGGFDLNQVGQQDVTQIMHNLQMAAAMSLFVEPVDDEDLNITEDNSPEAVKRYLEVVAPVLEENLLSPMKVSGVTLNGDFGLSNYYPKAYQTLLLTQVPSSWKEIHKKALNTFGQIISASGNLTTEKIIDDPVKATFALNQLQNSFLSFQSLLNEAAIKARSQSISTTDSVFELLKK